MAKKIPFSQVISALLDNSTVFPAAYLHHFTDLEEPEVKQLHAAWPQIEPSRRRSLLEDLEELSESDMLMLFDSVAIQALDDSDPAVRTVAIRMLWETDDVKLVPTFLAALNGDPSPEVRAAAASTLGSFVYQGELEEIPAELHHQIEDALIAVARSQQEKLVRRRAVEALGFSGRDEVPPLIQQAYDSRDPEWMASALFAMGRSYDQVWEPIVKRELRSPDAHVQEEAVRAAGELALDSARRRLLDLLEDEATDSEIRAAAIWSLSQIGGEEVREKLEEFLEETEDEEEAELIEEALDNLTLTEEGQETMSLLDIDLADKEHYGGVVDLEHEPDEKGEEEPDDEEPSSQDQ